MTYNAYQASRDGGSPVKLYKFVYGSDPAEYYAYTDHTSDITFGSITYTAVPISSDDIEADGTLDKSDLEVRTDIATGLAEIFRVYPPSQVTVLTIWEGHVEDPDHDYIVRWAGRITQAQREQSELVMKGEPVSTSMRRPGLRRHYQYGCMHELYGPQCRADKASKTVASTVAAISGASITLASGWNGAIAAEKFLGGMVEWVRPTGSTERRRILRITGNVLDLAGVPSGLAVSDAINSVAGCNHDAFAADGGDCQGLHNNLSNYGGCKFIPTKNPIGTYNIYY